VITLGTPYAGSKVLTIAEAVINGGLLDIGNAYVAFVEALLSVCAGLTATLSTNPCGILSALRSPVGIALQSDSAAIRNLPAWQPASLPVYDIAGNMDLFVGVGSTGFHIDPGDVAVTLPSATAHDTVGKPYELPCTASLLQLAKAPCFHNSLPDDRQVITAVHAAIQQAVAAQAVTDWYNASYTMTCGRAAAHPFTIRLKGGEGVAPGPGLLAGGYTKFEIHVEAVTKPGDLTGPGSADTAVLLYCTPQPSNFYNEEVQIFRPDGSLLAELPLAISLPGTPLYDSSQFSIKAGQLITGMKFYGPGDSHASGPSIHQTVAWHWDGHQFVHSPISLPQAPACPQAGPGIPAGLASAVAQQPGNLCGLEIDNLRADPNDPSWVLFAISPTPGSTAQGGGGIAHEVNGAWPVVQTGSAFYWCDPRVPSQVVADFGLHCP
jgi:hypothetical protein